MTLPMLKPEWQPDTPLYLQLYHRYREAITQGRLQPGERVPSVRNLASELNIARGTVEMAYQLLVSEGYFITRGAAGTVVSPHLSRLPEATPIPEPSRTATSRLLPSTDAVLPFQPGVPAFDAFPRKAWARLSGQTLRHLEMAMMNYPDPAGYAPLRQAIATYLGISRGITCSPEQVFITTGYQGAMELICRTLLQAGDSGWYEEPGYLFGRQYLQRAGMKLVPVAVDEEGLNVAAGQQQAADARFAVVTPSHQSPTGVALSLPRRLALLEWANRQKSWIIEDDYDSEFRYHGRPLPALKSLDSEQRVLYVGTFSKVLLPGLRLAYLVVPPSQVSTFQESAHYLPGPGSVFPQAMVATFMQQGQFARHLRKMRLLYATRRRWLEDALTELPHSLLHIQPQAGGIHVLARLPSGVNDKELEEKAHAAGMAFKAFSDWFIHPAEQRGLVMGFTNFTTAEETRQAVLELDALIKTLR